MTETNAQRRLAQLRHQGLPILVVMTFVLVAWYLGAWAMNAPGAIERVMPEGGAWGWQDLLRSLIQILRCRRYAV